MTKRRAALAPAAADPVTSEVIKTALIYASEEMGIAVRNAAFSPNIKERLDHSCALFDRRGRLIAQAEHIPVHLGSLPWGLERTLAVLAERGTALEPGEMWVVNDPYIAGTHLNDITVIRPIFLAGGEAGGAGDGAPRLAGYAANKAHHADVGGSVPGSISPDARELCVEGLVISPLRLMRGGEICRETLDLIRANSRTPEARGGDLLAQIAGNVIGERRVLELLARYGFDTYEAALERILDESERRMRAALRALGERDVDASDVLEPPDGGALLQIVAHVRTRDGTLEVDYTGTSAQVDYPLNAVFGVTLSAVHYVIRAATDPTIPMNDGCFRPVRVSAPLGTLLNPVRPAPVGGGNVETSARNCDVMLRAFAQLAPGRIPALSSGTMANVLVGGKGRNGVRWAFYETIGGGMGARPDADGIDGIHTHMTNTLNTPIEALERYFPIRVTRYEFARDTAGAGRFRGGSGLVRSFTLLDGSATVSLLAERQRVAPSGLEGGGDGAPGSHALRRGGKRKKLAAKVTFAIAPGEEVIVQTPGGGGYGDPLARRRKAASADRRSGLVRRKRVLPAKPVES
jgi:N-methylhydantoinase B